METFRSGTFETNSSSTHCLSVTKEPRHVSAFPELNADGSIDIEAKHFWQSDGKCDTAALSEIIEYICMLGLLCEKSLDSALKIIQQGYELAGRMPPDKINLYCLARDGSRIPYEELGSRVVNGPHEDWEDLVWKYYIYVPSGKEDQAHGFTHILHASVPVNEIDDYIAKNPHLEIDPGLELKDAPILVHRVGVSANDLKADTLEEALDDLTTMKYGDGKPVSILEAFQYVAVLNFWHS